MHERDEFEWDEENEDHIADHGVDRFEAEEAATDPAAVVRRVGEDRFGNPRYTYIGQTEDGRILFVVLDRKGRGRFRVGSARDAKFEMKRFYRKQRKSRGR